MKCVTCFFEKHCLIFLCRNGDLIYGDNDAIILFKGWLENDEQFVGDLEQIVHASEDIEESENILKAHIESRENTLYDVIDFEKAVEDIENGVKPIITFR